MESINYTAPKIVELKEMKLIGISMVMSLLDNKTSLLWKTLMPKRHEIKNNLNQDLISLQVYDANYFSNFNPKNEFVKWACVEVESYENIPDGMQTLTLNSGTYAVFNYKGLSTDKRIFEYIFGTWLPQSNYALDHRPHFEILGKKYKNNDPNSEEEIWIPIATKAN
jgi:AraC family transcriptional regulator